jgi:glycosyltransferase involved in cell wall biosynthesis
MREANGKALRVSVLVDLPRRPDAGGHVKVWERFALAAGRRDDIDLTVHFSGAPEGADDDQVETIAANVRLRAHRPVFSSARLPFLPEVPDHADLAPYHPGLARHLGGADVLHTTDAYFAFAKTAERVARRAHVPLVTSVHTNTPSYTRLYTTATVERLLGRRWPARLLLERWDLARLAEERMLRRLRDHQRLCAFSLLSRPAELEALAHELPRARLGLLRRGVDHALFSPGARDRPWLEATFGIPEGRLVLLYVGRFDRTKNLGPLIEAVSALRGEGWPLHLLCAGDGAERDAIRARLAGAASCPGVLDPETLARVYASSDLFAQPSELEECSNAIQEALASGLPVLVSERGGSGRLVADGETGIVVRSPSPPVASSSASLWAAALRGLVRDPTRRLGLGLAARRWAERVIPSWGDVLAQDLLPRWRAAAEGVKAAPEDRTSCRTL